MTAFSDLPIARKVVILGVVPTVCALLIVTTVYLASTFITMRRSVADDIATAAAMLADSVNLAVSFDDAATVRELATALRENKTITRACVYTVDGRLIAGYATARDSCPDRMQAALAVERGRIAALQPISINTRALGTVQVVGTLDSLYASIATQAIVTTIALAGAMAFALLLSTRLRAGIVGPIAELASTAESVSRTGDYSTRARQTTQDEVGRLVLLFNDMLARVEQSQAERADLLQREREASRLKDEFLATVSHELRTPLNAILGWTHILNTTAPPADTLKKALATLDRNAKVQTRLIEDLLEVSRLATGKLSLEMEQVDLCEVVRESLESLQGQAAAKHVALRLELPAHPAIIAADRVRLQQIVSNVAGNAIRFTPAQGSVVARVAAEGSEFVLRVSDTGIGIRPEFLPHVFDRFRQGDASTTREHGGLGLGLAIVRDLVHLHHGTVAAHSEGPGTGSEFTIRLPRLTPALLAGQMPVTGMTNSVVRASSSEAGVEGVRGRLPAAERDASKRRV